MSLIICDTNVFIRLFAGDAVVSDELVRIGSENILMPSITAMELYSGMGNKAEMQQMTKKLKRYNIIHCNDDASRKALEILHTFRLSHGTKIPDALIAGMTITYDLSLYTYNTKDFQYIPDIKIYPLP